MHVGAEGDHANSVEPPAIGVKEGYDIEGQNLCIKGISILEVVVPDRVNCVVEEFGSAPLGRFVSGAGVMGDSMWARTTVVALSAMFLSYSGRRAGRWNVKSPWLAGYHSGFVRVAMREWTPQVDCREFSLGWGGASL